MEENDDFQKRLAETIAKLKASGIKVTKGDGSYGLIRGAQISTRRKQPVPREEKGDSFRDESPGGIRDAMSRSLRRFPELPHNLVNRSPKLSPEQLHLPFTVTLSRASGACFNRRKSMSNQHFVFLCAINKELSAFACYT